MQKICIRTKSDDFVAEEEKGDSGDDGGGEGAQEEPAETG